MDNLGLIISIYSMDRHSESLMTSINLQGWDHSKACPIATQRWASSARINTKTSHLAASSAPAGSGLELLKDGNREVNACLPSKLLPAQSF